MGCILILIHEWEFEKIINQHFQNRKISNILLIFIKTNNSKTALDKQTILKQ